MCCLFCHLLVVLDDAELYEKGRPLPLHHIRALVKGLKRPLFVFHWEVRWAVDSPNSVCDLIAIMGPLSVLFLLIPPVAVVALRLEGAAGWRLFTRV